MDPAKEFIDLILPKNTLDWFDITSSSRDDETIRITLTEKDIPPIPKKYTNLKILDKHFSDITITDFPIRGRKALLTFRRRSWKLEGQNKYLKRDIKLASPGTKLEKEFAAFLKEDSRNPAYLSEYYRTVRPPTD